MKRAILITLLLTGGTPTVMLEETYDLRGVSFEAIRSISSRLPVGASI